MGHILVSLNHSNQNHTISNSHQKRKYHYITKRKFIYYKMNPFIFNQDSQGYSSMQSCNSTPFIPTMKRTYDSRASSASPDSNQSTPKKRNLSPLESSSPEYRLQPCFNGKGSPFLFLQFRKARKCKVGNYLCNTKVICLVTHFRDLVKWNW